MCWLPGLGHRNTGYADLHPLLLDSSSTPHMYFAGDTLLLFASDPYLHHIWYADVGLGLVSPAVPARPSPSSPRPRPDWGCTLSQSPTWEMDRSTENRSQRHVRPPLVLRNGGERDGLEYAHMRTLRARSRVPTTAWHHPLESCPVRVEKFGT